MTASPFKERSNPYRSPGASWNASGLELLLAGTMLIFGTLSVRPFGEVAGSAISLALDTRQTVGDELGLLHSRRLAAPRPFRSAP